MASAEPPAAGDPVRAYLAHLEVLLASQDPALRHDALVDAQVHLRDAIAAGASSDRAIAEYGTPEEVAAAYVAEEAARASSGGAPKGPSGAAEAGAHGHRTAGRASEPPAAASGSPPWSRRPARRLRDVPVAGIWFNPRAWGALAYFGAVGFVLSTAYFLWAVTVGALALGCSTMVVGIPIFVLLLGSARAICLFEGKVVEFFLGVRMPRRVQPIAGVDEVGFWRRIWCWLRDVRSWMSLGYLLGNFLVSIVTFTLTVTLAAVGAAFLAIPVLWVLGIPVAQASGDEGLTVRILGQQVSPDADGNLWLPGSAVIPSFAVGLVTLTATLWMVRGLGWVYGHVVQAIQVARPQPEAPRRA